MCLAKQMHIVCAYVFYFIGTTVTNILPWIKVFCFHLLSQKSQFKAWRLGEDDQLDGMLAVANDFKWKKLILNGGKWLM